MTFRLWWHIFHSDCPLCEIRMINKNARKTTASGYFKSCEDALKAIEAYPNNANVYAVLNEFSEGCYARYQHERIIDNPEATTSDKDVTRRRWILIDLDSERPTGCNATDAELNRAKAVMMNIGVFLRDNGFTSPVVSMSANGWHLYYRIDAPNDEHTTQAIQNFLKVLDMQFSNEDCKVDLSVFNASRISKVMGTKSNKGADTKDRPQRESYFVKIPDTISVTDFSYVEKVADMLPKEERPASVSAYGREHFDIEAFIRKYGIGVSKRVPFSGGMRLVLEQCPFDANHKAPDAAIFVMNSGAIGFRCLHNSCSHYTWHDVRMLYDPTAYSYNERAASLNRINYYKTMDRAEPVVEQNERPTGKRWLSLSDIVWTDPNADTYIPTGFSELDYQMGGFCLGDVTLMSGRAGCGKTSLINNIILNTSQRGYKVAVWSGELQPARFQAWIDQTAAGPNFVKQRLGDYQDWYYCPKDIAARINAWLDDKLVLRNNDYGNKWSELFEDIKSVEKENKSKLVILDNLASLSLDYDNWDKNEKQSRFIAELKDYAKNARIHVLLVAHPRKEANNTLLRMESISGTLDLVNLVDNVLLCHRVGDDFERRATEFFGKERTQACLGFSEVIEIAKNRSHGHIDVTVGLFYEPMSRRFKNSVSEYIVYGWQDGDVRYGQTVQVEDKPIPAAPQQLPFDMPDESVSPF